MTSGIVRDRAAVRHLHHGSRSDPSVTTDSVSEVHRDRPATPGQRPVRCGPMSEPKWTEADIPDQTGRTALVTGASGGIGMETARQLAMAGARVFLGCRNPAKASTALESIRASV